MSHPHFFNTGTLKDRRSSSPKHVSGQAELTHSSKEKNNKHKNNKRSVIHGLDRKPRRKNKTSSPFVAKTSRTAIEADQLLQSHKPDRSRSVKESQKRAPRRKEPQSQSVSLKTPSFIAAIVSQDDEPLKTPPPASPRRPPGSNP